jgi:hypothetical protein
MTMNRLYFFCFFGALCVSPLSAQDGRVSSPEEALGFEVGETLLYEAKFGFITLGSGMMNIAGVDTVRGAPSLHTIFVLRGGGMIYRLHDRMDSWIGVDDFASRRFIQDFHEGGSYRRNVWDIYPDSGYFIEEGIDSILETSPNPLDDLAFFYFVRTVDLEVGETYQYDRYFRPDRNPVVLEVLERDTLDLPAGRFPSIVVHPIIQGRGILAEGKEARMWISDDDRRLVVQLKVKFSFATITLRLKDIVDEPPEDMLQRPREGG